MPRRCKALRPWRSPVLTSRPSAHWLYTKGRPALSIPSPKFGHYRPRGLGPAISRNGCYGISGRVRGSIGIGAGELDNIAPLLSFVGEELAEVGRRER